LLITVLRAANSMGADEHINPSRKTVFTDFFLNVSASAPTRGSAAYLFNKSETFIPEIGRKVIK
jgi:hypothetical protein